MHVFLRFAANTDYLPNHFLTKAYDARMLYILSGRGEMYYGDTRIPLQSDTLCYYPAGTAYYPKSDLQERLRFITLNFDFSRAYAHIEQIISAVPEMQFVPSRAQMTHLDPEIPVFSTCFAMQNAWRFRESMLHIAEEFQKPTPHAREVAASLLQAMLYKLQDDSQESDNRVYRQVLEYIANHYASPLTNHSIARALNYHPNYLNVTFRQSAGMTLHRYLMQFRLQKAAQLLQTEALPVHEVAAMVGFENADHFSRRFRAEFGRTPTAHRRNAEWI